MPAESELEKRIVKHAKELGCLTFKFTSPSQAGVPDRIIISPAGACLFLEIKAPGKYPTPLQLRMIEKLRTQNTPAGWCDNITEAVSMIADLIQRPHMINKLY